MNHRLIHLARRRHHFILYTLSFIFLSCSAWAGIAVLYTPEGKPRIRDPNRPIQYRVDDGTLAHLDREGVLQRLEEAFDAWRGVKTSSLQIEPLKQLAEDVTWQSYETYRIQDVVVIDQDGNLIKNLFGSATAVSGYTSWYFNRDRLEAACILLNGKATGYRKDIIIHEIGHALGLGHYDTPGIPILGPIMSYNPRRAMGLTWDDRLTLSWFYPTEAVLRDWGQITGRVVDWAERPVPGGIVLAQRCPEPVEGRCPEPALSRACSGVEATAELNSAFRTPHSAVASSLSSGVGKKDGSFIFPRLPPGDYTLRLEPIPPYYTRGGGPQTYASEYVSGHPRDYSIPAEFYSGPAESASWISDPTPSLAKVTIRAGSGTTLTLIRNLTLPTWEDATKVTDLDFSSPLNRTFPRLGSIRGQAFLPRGSQISEVALFFDSPARPGVELLGEQRVGRVFLWPTGAKGQPDPRRPVFTTEPIRFQGARLGTRLNPPVRVSPGQYYYLGADAPDSLSLYIKEDDYPHGWLAWGRSLEKSHPAWDTRFLVRYVPEKVPLPTPPSLTPNTTRLILPEPTPHSASHSPARPGVQLLGEQWAFDAFPTKGVRLLQPFVAVGDRLECLGLLVAADVAVFGPLNLAIAGPIGMRSAECGGCRVGHWPTISILINADLVGQCPTLQSGCASRFCLKPPVERFRRCAVKLAIPRSAFRIASTQLPLPTGIHPQYLIWKPVPPIETRVNETYGLLVWCESGPGRYLFNLQETPGDSVPSLVVIHESLPTAHRPLPTDILGGFVLKSFFDWAK